MKLSSFLCAALVALAAAAAPTASQADSGRVRLTIYKAGWIIGGSGGSGVLHFHGRSYPLTLGGLDYGLVFGGSKTVLRGTVRNIERPSDVAGVYGANVVPISIINAPPNAPVLLRIGSYSPAFHVQYGATMVSGLPSATLSYTTDSTGKVLTSLWTGDLPADVHYQAVVEDANQPSGYTTSNAVRIDPLWTDMLAARNERYKLIRLNPCEEELYDLAVDPIELNDLLLQPLGAEALAAYEELAFELDTLR